MIKNLVFDFGQVLIAWNPRYLYAPYFGDEAKTAFFLTQVCNSDFNNSLDLGIPYEKVLSDKNAEFPEYEKAIQMYYDRWHEMVPGEIPGMKALLDRLRAKGHTLYGLTNFSSVKLAEARARFDIFQRIDHTVVSAEEHLVKPDPRFFRLLLDRYGLKAEETFFTDDNADNIAAARRLGLEGFVFTTADALEERLHSLIGAF